MSLQISDSIDMNGELSIYIRPEGASEPFLFFSGKNRITNKARKHLLAMAVGLAPAYNPIVSFKVGEGGVAQVPSGTELDLYDPLDPDDVIEPYSDVVTYSFSDAPTDMVAEYAFEVSASDLVGKTLSEVGLFCLNNWNGSPASTDHMFNIKVFPAVVKTNSFALVFVWRVNFSGAC